jgi:two-component system phosphate regulon response regulator PhoB
MQRILLIEDQQDFQLMVKALIGQRCDLLIASNAREALRLAREAELDLILLDVSLPDESGFHLIAKLQALPSLKEVPIVFLTAKAEVTDRVTGFSLGADDYIVKPFEPLEFRARIESKLQLRLSRKQGHQILRAGRLELDCAMFRAFGVDASGKKTDLNLTPHEFRLLNHFLTHEGHVLSRDQLMTTVWGGNIHVLERTIDRHISALRRKLDSQFEEIEAVHGYGYRFRLVGGTQKAS